MSGKPKVLIVDDSVVIRTFLKDTLEGSGEFEIIGSAANPFQARDMMRNAWPDVITLDIEMPRMNGIEFLRKVMAAKPTPVVMISTLTKKGAAITLEALNIGAVDYIPKPEIASWHELDTIKANVIEKVRSATRSNLRRPKIMVKPVKVAESREVSSGMLENRLVVMGSSTGGVQALNQVFSQFPSRFPPVLVVQHMPAAFIDSLAEQLAKKSGHSVRVAQDGESLKANVILLAPGDVHLTVSRLADRYVCHHLPGPPVGYHKPAVNVLFNSAAKIGGANILGVIMTGMGEDGAEGMLNMKNRGCVTIGQDEESCIVYGMPRKAFERGAVGRQLPLTEIAQAILSFASGEKP